MAQAAIRLTTRVLPGKRVEFTAPELTVGDDVEVFVALPQAPPETTQQETEYISAIDFLDALPPSTLTSEDWQRIEREIQVEKDAWDR
jgi:hypothetical protein